MSATNRDARKHAVCGNKPGGPDAYYFKESCVPKNRPARQASRRQQHQDTDANTKLNDVLEFSKLETLKLITRQQQVKNKPLPANLTLPMRGTDHGVIRKYIFDARLHPNDSVRKRIKLACDQLNERRTQNKIVCNPILEKLVIMGALNHYSGIRKEIDPAFRIRRPSGH